jgi:gamma-glutamylcyclotransferase (GGCT)/AIG2-like uncharacterized protein YtfP
VSNTHLYFAYGSNLNLDGMASRCPDSEPVGIATLSDWALTFRGVADIEPRKGTRAIGALWRISARDLERLDAYEGYPGLYRRELLAVQATDGPIHAITYVMNDDYLGLPSSAYFQVIRRGYEQWDLPIEALERALAVVMDRLFDLGVRAFEPDGPKRLRPSAA